MTTLLVIISIILLYLTYRYIKYRILLRKIYSTIYAYAYRIFIENKIEEEIDPWDQFHYYEIKERWYVYVFCIRPLNMSLFYDTEDLNKLTWKKNS